MKEMGIKSLDRVSTRIWHCSDTETLKCSGLLLNGSALSFARQRNAGQQYQVLTDNSHTSSLAWQTFSSSRCFGFVQLAFQNRELPPNRFENSSGVSA